MELSEKFRIWSISTDEATQRQLTQILAPLGFDILQVGSKALVDLVVGTQVDGIALLDLECSGLDALAICRDWRKVEGIQPQIIAISSSLDPEVMARALEAGIDDFIRRPISMGEVLTRIRAAARLHEHERRSRVQTTLDSLTGLSNELSFRRILSDACSQGLRAACAIVDIDLLSRVNVRHGRSAANAVIIEAGKRLSNELGEGGIIAALGDGAFGVLVDGPTEDSAIQFLNAMRQSICEAPFDLGGGVSIAISASVGVSLLAERPEQTLDQTRRALHAAKALGRGRVAGFESTQASAKRLPPETISAQALSNTIARDVLTPTAVVMYPEDTLDQAAAIFRQTGAAHLAVTDHAGHFLGLVSRSSVTLGPQGKKTPGQTGSVRLVRHLMTSDVTKLPEDATFDEIMQNCGRDGNGVAAILREKRILGLVYSNQLADLQDRVTPMSFKPAEPVGFGVQHLVVADYAWSESA